MGPLEFFTFPLLYKCNCSSGQVVARQCNVVIIDAIIVKLSGCKLDATAVK